MAIKLAPSNNPEKESKLFGTIALICGIASLFVWFFGIGGIVAGGRGAILSKRVNSNKYLIFSIVGIALGVAALAYFHTTN